MKTTLPIFLIYFTFVMVGAFHDPEDRRKWWSDDLAMLSAGDRGGDLAEDRGRWWSGDLSDDGLDRGGYGHKGHHWPHKRPGRWWSGDLTMQMGVDGSGDLSDDGLDRWGYGRPGHHWPYGPTPWAPLAPWTPWTVVEWWPHNVHGSGW